MHRANANVPLATAICASGYRRLSEGREFFALFTVQQISSSAKNVAASIPYVMPSVLKVLIENGPTFIDRQEK
jgi:hypothetical protein